MHRRAVAAPPGVQEATFYSEGQRCAAHLFLPLAGGAHAAPGVVLCGGLRGVKEWFLPALAELYAAAGFTVLTFDYRGLGESEGHRGSLMPAGQVEDVRSAAAFLGSVSGVDPGRLAVHGVGFGASIAVSAAAIDRRIGAVVAQAGIGDVRRAWVDPMDAEKRRWLEEMLEEDRIGRVRSGASGLIDPGEILDNEQSRAAMEEAATRFSGLKVDFTLEAVGRILELQPERVVDRLAPRGLLVIGATRDRAAPVSESMALYEAAAEPKRVVLFDLEHYELFASPHRERVIDLAAKWLAKRLPSPAAA